MATVRTGPYSETSLPRFVRMKIIFFGKLLVAKISERDGVNFASENQVSHGFCGRVPFKGEWVMRPLFIYEMLVYAYEFRRQSQTQAIDRSPLVDQGEDAISMGWNDQNEINH
jgi:hypothetical protein